MRESLRKLASNERVSSPLTARRAGTRRVRVELLDGGVLDVDVERKAKGCVLLDKVCEDLELEACDFFGLLHAQRGDPRVWLDLNRRLSKTFKNEPWEVRLAVKFYPQEPAQLRDEVARDQLMYAVRRDLMEGRLSCSFITYALLGSYILQAEVGDCEDQLSSSSLLQHHVAPTSVLTVELEDKIHELHRLHRGQSPAEAVLNYLLSAVKLPQYGAEPHCALDAGGGDLLLSVAGGGVAVYRDGMLMNRFPWAKMSKISYNKRSFTLRLRPSEFDECETSITFRLVSTRACKKLWRCSVEHHMFFRRAEPVPVKRVPRFPGLGSRRLSCRRTLRQLRDDALQRDTHFHRTEAVA